MTENHRFVDEWLARTLATCSSLKPEVIDTLRKERIPSLADGLIAGAHATEDFICEAVHTHHQIPPIPTGTVGTDRWGRVFFPETLCQRLQVFPVRTQENRVDVAMVNPLDLDAQADLAAISGREIVPFYGTPNQILSLISASYQADFGVSALVERLGVDNRCEFVDPETHTPLLTEEPDIWAPVNTLVNSLLTKAILTRASDVHIEQGERGTEVRFRIDGTLRNVMTVPRDIGAGPLVSRIKRMGNLDGTDPPKPQEGRAQIRVSGNDIELRISCFPSSFGEKIVVRLLDPRSAHRSLLDMGFGSTNVARMETLLNLPQGVIVVTGPPGSGKTTTLYGFLNKLKSPDIHIITLEDPVEYRLEGMSQVHVNERQGMTFATALQSVLRQKPDAIFVGEMRDAQTASTVFQAAVTGHLVITTLETHNALSAINRLIDLGVDRFKLAPVLLAITAQRLVRRLCASCRRPVPYEEIPPFVVRWMRYYTYEPTLYHPGGCSFCGFSGYVGQLALLEFLHMNRELRDRIYQGGDASTLHSIAENKGDLKTLRQDALWHLTRGDTSLEEISSHLVLKEGEKPQPVEKFQSPPSPSARRILIADNDPVLRTMLHTLLANSGFEVIEAADGREALVAASQTNPDLMMVDVHMPHVDGFDVIKGIRGIVGKTGLPIVGLIGDTGDANRFQALDMGADDYLLKPIKPTLVLARINAVWRRLGKSDSSPPAHPAVTPNAIRH
ncbi:MAG: Flp pilus assembly complex ATPase component TadA [Elusimicrobia bacterium]|nr:Flp pilus assembly complex ATPase component TadA [Elusimicrobiota bacterium]